MTRQATLNVCVKQADTVRTTALADAEMGGARMDAAQNKRAADYKVAVAKCDAMSGDAKSNCIAAAKSEFAPTATKSQSEDAAEARVIANYKADAATCDSPLSRSGTTVVPLAADTYSMEMIAVVGK